MKTINEENIEYAGKMFDMNMKVKTLLYKASIDPINRRHNIDEASKLIDTFYGLPKGMITTG